MLICITGLPGSGKSSVSELLKQGLARDGLDVAHYTSDWMRYKLYPELRQDLKQMGRDFTEEELRLVYNALFMLFEELFRANPDLVVLTDGTYRSRAQRDPLRQIAERHSQKFFLVRVVSSEAATEKRLQKRLSAKKGAGMEAYFSAKAQYEEPTGNDLITIDNSGTLAQLELKVAKALKEITERS